MPYPFYNRFYPFYENLSFTSQMSEIKRIVFTSMLHPKRIFNLM